MAYSSVAATNAIRLNASTKSVGMGRTILPSRKWPWFSRYPQRHMPGSLIGRIGASLPSILIGLALVTVLWLLPDHTP